MKKLHWYFIVLAGILVLTGAGCSQQKTQPEQASPIVGEKEDVIGEEEAVAPENVPSEQIKVSDQAVKDGIVVVDSATSLKQGWVVIHTDSNGTPGEVIGYTQVSSGTTNNVSVQIDVTKQTSKLYAMLHEDTGELGVYNFPQTDSPVKVEDNVIVASFNVISDAKDTTSNMPALDGGDVKETEVNENGEVQAPLTQEPTVKEFSITALKWEFQPSTITVKKGDTVKLTIKSIDVTHGFGLTEFNINAQLEPGKDTTVEFVADKAGTFSFFCSVFCGSGHASMKGTLVVEE